MEKILVLWFLFMIYCCYLERKLKKRRERKTFFNRVDKINSFRKKEYENIGLLNKYKPIVIKN